MLKLTKEIIQKAYAEVMKPDNKQTMLYHVRCVYGESMGYGSANMLSMSVKAELKALGFEF